MKSVSIFLISFGAVVCLFSSEYSSHRIYYIVTPHYSRIWFFFYSSTPVSAQTRRACVLSHFYFVFLLSERESYEPSLGLVCYMSTLIILTTSASVFYDIKKDIFPLLTSFKFARFLSCHPKKHIALIDDTAFQRLLKIFLQRTTTLIICYN